MPAESNATARRLCVFCGSPPVNKNKEHILPQWLLRMTGDPSRVVKFGTNFEKQTEIEFSWSNLVMPSCTSCNERYSQLENDVKPIIEALAERTTIKTDAYLTLLDWLDKVRVGLWLAYHVLQGNPTNIQPSFHINSRIGTKDRLVAVYPINTDNQGLNAFGVESFVFHRTPSCFALRINNLLLLNASADFLFAARCGFPFPRVRKLHLDGPDVGLLQLRDFECARFIKRPLLRMRICKPSVLLFQPIMQRSIEPALGNEFVGNYATFDSFLAEHTFPPYLSGKGILFREFPDRHEYINNTNQDIAFDTISGIESQPMYSLVAQVYEIQNFIQDLSEPVALEPKLIASYRKKIKIYRNWNTRVSNYLRSQTIATTR